MFIKFILISFLGCADFNTEECDIIISLVFQRMPMKNLLRLADVSPWVLSSVYREINQRLNKSPIIRLWSTEVCPVNKYNNSVILTKGYSFLGYRSTQMVSKNRNRGALPNVYSV